MIDASTFLAIKCSIHVWKTISENLEQNKLCLLKSTKWKMSDQFPATNQNLTWNSTRSFQDLHEGQGKYWNELRSRKSQKYLFFLLGNKFRHCTEKKLMLTIMSYQQIERKRIPCLLIPRPKRLTQSCFQQRPKGRLTAKNMLTWSLEAKFPIYKLASVWNKHDLSPKRISLHNFHTILVKKGTMLRKRNIIAERNH